jgi:general secretion pathway protein A
MYTHYFGLIEKPFAIAPNPKYLYMSEPHREALAHLLFGINGDGCITLLTGDVGTGKTTACRCLLEQLPEKTDVAIILNPRQSISELLKTVCEELGIPVKSSTVSIKDLIDAIYNYLLEAHAKNRNTALIIDEAQNLKPEALEQLRLLTNLETDTKKLLQIVLIGQPELRDLLKGAELEQISQRITSRYHLGPLSREDISTYVTHRLEVAGLPPGIELFDKKTIRFLSRLSKGIPRVINLLCDRSLLGAYGRNKDRVTVRLMKEAAKELRYPLSSIFDFKLRGLAIAAILALLFSASIVFYYYINFQHATTEGISPTTPRDLLPIVETDPSPQ